MNKKNLIFVFVGLFLIVSVFGFLFVSGGRIFLENSSESVSISSLKKGLVGYWTLDELNYNSNTNRVTDKSAYENHGTNYGATFAEDRMGNSGGAMSFDGVGNYILIEDSPSTDEVFGLSDTYTISAWAYANSWSNWATIINKASGGSWSNTLNGLWAYTSGYRCVMGSGVGGNPSGSSIGPVYNPGLNEWHHILCVADGNTLKIYVDGVYRGQSSISSLTYPRSDIDVPVVIGRRAVSTSPTFDGDIDEIRAYNRALSEDEIKLLYDSHKPKVVSGSTQKGLILDMPLSSRYTKSETAGSEIITDRTPYSNDGQNYGATLGIEGASFDGVNDYINLPNAGILNGATEFTSSFWTKLDSRKGYIFWKPASNTFLLQAQSNGQYRLRLNLDGAWRGTYYFSYPLAEWHHVVFSWDGTTTKVYLDGELVVSSNTDSAYSSLSSSSTDFHIGRRDSDYIDGQISNIKIYNRALSDEEVKSLYDKGRY